MMRVQSCIFFVTALATCVVADLYGGGAPEAPADGLCGEKIIHTNVQGCCYTGSSENVGFQVIPLDSTKGCCNTRENGRLQEVIDITVLGCCGYSPGCQKTYNIRTEACCVEEVVPSGTPCTHAPTYSPTRKLSSSPSLFPTWSPSGAPTISEPTEMPSARQSSSPSEQPSPVPSATPSQAKTSVPSFPYTSIPSVASEIPTFIPSIPPSSGPSAASQSPTSTASDPPSRIPSAASSTPTSSPSKPPSQKTSSILSNAPNPSPTEQHHTQSCVLPTYLQGSTPGRVAKFSLITKEDAKIAAKSIYSSIAIGGTLSRLIPSSSNPNANYNIQVNSNSNMAMNSYAMATDSSITSVNTDFNGNLVISNDPLGDAGVNFSDFEELTNTAVASNNVADGSGTIVVVEDQGDFNATKDLFDFRPGGQGEDNGNTIVFFKGTGTITLKRTSSGRPFGPSVVAPFAHVELHGNIGFVDGFIVAKSFTDLSTTDSGTQMHGNAFIGDLICKCQHPSRSLSLVPSLSPRAPSCLPQGTFPCFNDIIYSAVCAAF